MPELTAGQSINKALSLILESNQTAFIAGEDFPLSLLWLHDFEYRGTIRCGTILVSIIVCPYKAIGRLKCKLR